MPTQRRFEANSLAAVLAKVQKEVGPAAKISSAQKARSGGVLGFFQRERFEVLVEIPDPGTPAAAPAPVSPPPAPAPAASLLELAEQLNVAERQAPEEPAPAPRPTEPPFTRPAPINDAVSTRAEAPTPEKAEISTESDSFAEILSRIAFQSDMQSSPQPERRRESDRVKPPVVETPKVEPAPIAEILDVEEEDDDFINNPYVEDYVKPAPTPPVIEDRPAFLDAPAAASEESTDPPEDDVVDEDERVVVIEPDTHVFAKSLPRFDEPANVLTPELEEPEPVAATEAHIVLHEPHELDTFESAFEPDEAFVTARTRISDSPLAKLGLPAPFIPQIPEDATSTQIQKALTLALDELPKAPVIRPSKGSVIAVVGARDEALELAEELAHKWGRPKEEIVLASQNFRGKGSSAVVRNTRNAEDSRRSWSRRGRPTIVAVEANMGSKEAMWAEHILEALEPIATYGAVDATRKAEDISAWADALGGLDCLALNYVDETVSPAAVLATGIPVERIDGRKATAAFWAMLLAERLPAA